MSEGLCLAALVTPRKESDCMCIAGQSSEDRVQRLWVRPVEGFIPIYHYYSHLQAWSSFLRLGPGCLVTLLLSSHRERWAEYGKFKWFYRNEELS